LDGVLVNLSGINMKKLRFSSGTKWESYTGYSRALRMGHRVLISGTTATDKDSKIVGVGDAYKQTIQTLQNIERAIKSAGAELVNVVRTRIYVTDINVWEDVARAHGEFFGQIKPVTSLVGISWLVDPDMLVEIEAEAIISEED